ncbi:dr1-associated corepressor [Dorcoceras hygrometricum]|uniref:Dr1-associated corepressor n=1 Tax=Dorcoceras hygrometricum TaxID=472368 RepID=A0A2Z7BBJ4_9LAMI|nr:dr1-associated corepressor [Dorcoceras hygrometricum]
MSKKNNSAASYSDSAASYSDSAASYSNSDAAPSQLGGRHSNPVVTTPTIALDLVDTTQQSASHNVAPNQKKPAVANKEESVVALHKIFRRRNKPAVGRHGSAVAQTRCINQLQRKEEFEEAVALRKSYQLLIPSKHEDVKLCVCSLSHTGVKQVIECTQLRLVYIGVAMSSPGARLGDSSYSETFLKKEEGEM